MSSKKRKPISAFDCTTKMRRIDARVRASRTATVDRLVHAALTHQKKNAPMFYMFEAMCAMQMLGLFYMANRYMKLPRVPRATNAQKALAFYMCWRFSFQDTFLKQLPRNLVLVVAYRIMNTHTHSGV